MNEFKEGLRQNPYFQSLPAWIQESICQSGVELASEKELRAYVKSLSSAQSLPKE